MVGMFGAFRNLGLKIKSAPQGADPDNELERNSPGDVDESER